MQIVVVFFSGKLQTNILIFSKKPYQIESQYFHQHQISRLFICSFYEAMMESYKK